MYNIKLIECHEKYAGESSHKGVLKLLERFKKKILKNQRQVLK